MKLELKLKEDLRGNLVTKKYLSLFLFLFLFSCSLNPNSKFWTKEKKIIVDKKTTTVLVSVENKTLKEFNENFKISAKICIIFENQVHHFVDLEKC